MTTKKWVRLRVEKEWESLTFYLGKKELKAGEHTIRWKDGHIEKVKVVMVESKSYYLDMGNEHEVTNQIPNITIKLHGQEILIPAEKTACEFLI